MSTKFVTAVEAILELVRGHTNLQALPVRWYTNVSEHSTARQYVAVTAAERADVAPSPAAFFMEQVWFEISGLTEREENAQIGTTDLVCPPDRTMILMEDPNTGIAQVSCRLAFIQPGGSRSGMMRTFLFRDDHIHRIM